MHFGMHRPNAQFGPFAFYIALVAGVLLLSACAGGGAGNGGTTSFSISGTVTGLNGALVLLDNATDDLAVSASGAFTFATKVATGAAYNVTIKTAPAAQTCVVANGGGIVPSANVTNVAITCTTNSFTIGGNISGLNAGGLTLTNGADTVSPAANSTAFTFPTPAAFGASYSVAIATQPTGLTCAVVNGTGSVTGNVSNVSVTCVPLTYSIGGTISGLTADGLVLANGGESMALASTAITFSFTTKVASGIAYSVTVATQPAGQNCAVTNGAGTVAGANVSNVLVSCSAARFMVKDVMYQDSIPTHPWYHTIFHYDDKLQISSVDQATAYYADQPDNYVVTRSTAFAYDANGRLVSSKPSDGRGETYQYTTDFVITISPVNFDPTQDDTTTFDFNVHSHMEIDQRESFVPPAKKSGAEYSFTIGYFYNDTGGVQAASATNYDGVLEAQWASYSANPSSPIANAFSNGTTLEQRLIYYIFRLVPDWDMLGPSWSNGVFENYVYSSGSKEVSSRVYNTYTLDGNNNVVKVDRYGAGDAPGFTTFVKGSPLILVYEKH